MHFFTKNVRVMPILGIDVCQRHQSVRQRVGFASGGDTTSKIGGAED